MMLSWLLTVARAYRYVRRRDVLFSRRQRIDWPDAIFCVKPEDYRRALRAAEAYQHHLTNAPEAKP